MSNINDLLYDKLGTLGFVGALPDRAYNHLGSLGYTGAMNDRLSLAGGYRAYVEGLLGEDTFISWLNGDAGLLAEQSESLKFLPYNGWVSADGGDYGALLLDTAGVGTLFEIGSDGVFFISMDLPMESTFENRTYNIFGGTFSGGRTLHIDYAGGGHFLAARQNTFRVSVRGSAGTTISLTSGVVLHSKVLLAITKNGDTFAVKTVNCETSAITTGSSQTSVDSQIDSPLDFWVGYAGSTTLPSLPFTSNDTMFTGSIESFGYVDVTPTDSMITGYAMGDGLSEAFGLSNIRFARELKGVDTTSISAVAGTTDPTPALIPSGTGFSTGGSVRRTTKNKWLQLSDKVEGYVSALTFGGVSATFPLGGTTSETSGTVQARVIWDNDTTYSQWRDVAVIDAGVWSGELVAPSMSEWGYVETRLKSDESITSISRKKMAFGYKIFMPNQSQCRFMCTDDLLGVTLTSGKGALTKIGSRIGAGLQSYVFDTSFSNSDGISALIDYIYSLTSVVTSVVSNSVPGTGARAWIDDTDPVRSWADTVAILDVAGKDFSSIIWQWGSSDNVGLTYGEVFDAVLNGTGPLAADHFINDGTFDSGFKFAVSPFSRSTPTSAGPFDFDSSNVALTRQGQSNWVAANPTQATLGSYVNDMAIEPNGGPHQLLGDIRGSTRLALRMADAIARSMEFTTLLNPEISTMTLTNSTTITGAVSLPNGGAIRTDGIANLQGFEVSVDAGATWSRAGFVGAITTTSGFTLVKDAGSWLAGTMVRYQSGSPLGYGTSVEPQTLYKGCLYDGTSFDSGLGIPVSPMLEVTV